MLATTTARIIFIGLSAASSVQPVEDGSLPKIGAAGNGDDVDGVPSLSESDDCGCVLGEGKFCGNDGQCHFYNCEEYYKYGPVIYTGYGPDAPELECRDTTAETEAGERDSSSWSVAFRCRSLDPPPITRGWTRYCEASTPLSNFTCYGLAKNTDFQSFLTEAETSNLECNSDVYNETGYPQYTYTVTMSRPHQSTCLTGFDGTETFDRNKALVGTMSSSFETLTVPPTSSPTKYPTASPTLTITPSSSTGTIGIGTSAIVAGIIFSLI